MSPGEAHHLFRASLLRRLLITPNENSRYREEHLFAGSVRVFRMAYLLLPRDVDFAAHSIFPFSYIRRSLTSPLRCLLYPELAAGILSLSPTDQDAAYRNCSCLHLRYRSIISYRIARLLKLSAVGLLVTTRKIYPCMVCFPG